MYLDTGWFWGIIADGFEHGSSAFGAAARSSGSLCRRRRGAHRRVPVLDTDAQEAADAVGTSVGQIVKSLVFLGGGVPILALVSGANRLDPSRLGALTGLEIGKADADAVRRATGYSIGGVPPTGFPAPIPTFVDRDLLQYDVVWAAAGTPRHVFPIAPQDLVRITGGRVVQLATDQG